MNINPCIMFAIEGNLLLLNIWRFSHYLQCSKCIFISAQPSLRVCFWFWCWFGDTSRCAKSSLQRSNIFHTYHIYSHGTPVPVIRDPSYSDGLLECLPRVWHSAETDTSQFTLHILSDTPGGSQWLKCILLMEYRLLLDNNNKEKWDAYGMTMFEFRFIWSSSEKLSCRRGWHLFAP